MSAAKSWAISITSKTTRRRALEEQLRQAGNSDEQIEFWMNYCVELVGDEDGDQCSAVVTEIGLKKFQGNLETG